LIEITNDVSYVLIMCVIGVWWHIVDCNRQGELTFGAGILHLNFSTLCGV